MAMSTYYYSTAWDNWNSTSTATTASSSGNDIWYTWTCDTSTSATSSSSTWTYWTSQPKYYYETVNIKEPTKAELAAEARKRKAIELQRRKEQRAYELKRKAEERKKKLAEETALKLLHQFLDEKQKKELKDMNGFFFITDDGKWFRINKGRSNNIQEIEKINDKEIRVQSSICRHVMDYIPDYDNMLAQFLELKNDWKGFISKSNRSNLGRTEPLPETRR